MSENNEDVDPLGAIVDEFLASQRGGTPLSLDELSRKYPQHAIELEGLIPLLSSMERAASGFEAASTATPSVREIGRYRLHRLLGRGGMGAVYEARLIDAEKGAPQGERYALKLIHPHLLDRPALVVRFKREIELGRRIDHPAVTRTVDADSFVDPATGAEMHYLVSELVDGQTLMELARGLGGVLPEALVRTLALKIADGLNAIHEAGIVHRDLKPSNIMIDRESRVRIMDLGIARAATGFENTGLASITEPGQFVGSARYAAPELFDWKLGEPSPATDLYSLGISLFELAVGRHPFAGARTPSDMRHAHLKETPPLANELNPTVSHFFAQLVRSLLQKAPEQRQSSALVFAKILREGEESKWWRAQKRLLQQRPPLPPRAIGAAALPLVGRGNELNRLLEDVACARNGRGVSLLLEGEAGIGKSRLIAELVEMLGNESATIVRGSHLPGHGGGGLRAGLMQFLDDAGGDSAFDRLLPGAASVKPKLLAYLQRRPQARGERMEPAYLHSLILMLIDAMAERAMLVIVVEDIHFAEDADVEILAAMARSIANRRVLLIATARSEPSDAPDQPTHRRAFTRREQLARLDSNSAHLLLRQALASERFSEALLDRVVANSDGNPLFALQTLEEIRRHGGSSALASNASWSADSIERLPLPRVIEEAVSARLAAISDREREILECGALIGFELEPALIAEAISADQLEVLESLAILERRHGLVRSRGGLVAFDHHLVMEVLLCALSPVLAGAYHEQIALALSRRIVGGESTSANLTAAIALHAMQSQRWDLALPVARSAVSHLIASHRLFEAAQLIDLAFDSVPPLPDEARAEYLLDKCVINNWICRTQENGKLTLAALAAAEASGRQDLALKAMMSHAHDLLSWRAKNEEALSWNERALELAKQIGDHRAEIKTTLQIVHHHRDRGRFDEARRIAGLAQAIAVTAGLDEENARVSLSRSMIEFHTGEYRRAGELVDDCLRFAESAGAQNQSLLGSALIVRGNVFYVQGVFAEARRCWERGLAVARALFDRDLATIMQENLAGALLAEGDLGGAIERYQEAVQARHEMDRKSIYLYDAANLANAWLEAGELASAEIWLARARAAVPADGHPLIESRLCLCEARLRWCRGDLAGATVAAQESMSIASAIGPAKIADSQLLLGLLAMETGDRATAIALVTSVHELAVQRGEMSAAAYAASLLARLNVLPADQIEVPATATRLAKAEILLHLHAAAPEAGHLMAAAMIMKEVEDSLPEGQARNAFRTSSPLAQILARLD